MWEVLELELVAELEREMELALEVKWELLELELEVELDWELELMSHK